MAKKWLYPLLKYYSTIDLIPALHAMCIQYVLYSTLITLFVTDGYINQA